MRTCTGARVRGAYSCPEMSDVTPYVVDSYNVAADGQRFLVNTAVEQKASAPITLVLNWTAPLKR